jgi:hypothetical protein
VLEYVSLTYVYSGSRLNIHANAHVNIGELGMTASNLEERYSAMRRRFSPSTHLYVKNVHSCRLGEVFQKTSCELLAIDIVHHLAIGIIIIRKRALHIHHCEAMGVKIEAILSTSNVFHQYVLYLLDFVVASWNVVLPSRNTVVDAVWLFVHILWKPSQEVESSANIEISHFDEWDQRAKAS